MAECDDEDPCQQEWEGDAAFGMHDDWTDQGHVEEVGRYLRQPHEAQRTP